MAGPLDGSRYCVSRGREHILALQSEIEAFFRSDPFASVTEVDGSSHEDIHKIKLVKAMPESLCGIAFDAVSNLRAALDQAGHAIGVGSGAKGRCSAFPFGDTLSEVESRAKGGSKDIPVPMFGLMVASGPYGGGNDLLWALNKLCNLHKHEIVIPVAIYTGSGYIKEAQFSAVKKFVFPPKWDPARQEMVLAVVPHGSAGNWNMEIETVIAIAKVEGVVGKPAVMVLNGIANVVERIVNTLETEGMRLGYLK